MLAIEGFTALRRRGLEIGGLLLGSEEGDELHVDRFLEVPCEHRFGPSYALSDTDREKLTELLAGEAGGNSRVLGVFRSFTARDPVMDPADEGLVTEQFARGDFLFLCLQPLSVENCVVSLRLFRDGHVVEADAPVPVEVNGVAKEEERAPAVEVEVDEEPAAVETPSKEPEELPRVAAERAEESAPPRAPSFELPRPATLPGFMAAQPDTKRRPVLWWAAIVLMAGALGGSFAYELGRADRPSATAAPQWAELNLDVRPAGANLEITWDPNAARSVRATRGALTISDGGAAREIELGAAQIGAGKYSYAAGRADVAIRLTLSAEGRTVASESARVRDAAVTPPPPPAPVVAPDTHAEVAPSAVHEVQPVVPEGIRPRVNREITIDVEVKVSEQGRVLHAQAKNPGAESLARYLAGLAEKAAREWRFTPARNHAGQPVAGSKTIHFVFGPTS